MILGSWIVSICPKMSEGLLEIETTEVALLLLDILKPSAKRPNTTELRMFAAGRVLEPLSSAKVFSLT